ncbi:MAG TPA: ATP-dependent helicase [Acidimicrobiia bacterium]
MDALLPLPGRRSLGRGLVVGPDDPMPEPAEAWPRFVIDDAVLRDPAEAVSRLDAWWRGREPSVVVLGVPFAELKRPETNEEAPYLLDPRFEFQRERLHYLTWVNRYDGRGGALRWHHTDRALRLGATRADGHGDILVEGRPFWIDGGPRGPLDGLDIVHVESVWSGRLEPDRWREPAADLAPDQLEAVAHPTGSARIIAPAGSGKTRVLTERLRHLLVDRGWNGDVVTALAYNRRAAEEMATRLAEVPAAHVRTLHAFGYEILGRASGRRPRLLEEREVRRLLDRLANLRPRANEDVHAPWLEALAEVRVALRPPEEVEASRDDVPGFALVFEEYRRILHSQGAIDHDEQIYGAIEVLLRRPDIRAWAQARCRHLLVDEFQDLTPAHLLLARLLAAPGYDVFGVGDDDQVIYGYAGATPSYLIDYADFFPGAAHHQLRVNYRCPAPVVEAAANLLSHNRRRIGKTVTAASTATSGIEVVRAAEKDMGRQLVAVTRELIEADGPESVAVLARVNVGLLVPQITFGEHGIPTETALDATLLDRSGVRSALAWLRLGAAVARQEPLTGADLDEATRRPARGLSPGVRAALGRGMWTFSRLASFAAGADDERTRTKLGGLTDDLAVLGRLAAEEPVSAQLLYIRDQLGLGDALERLDHSRTRPTGGHTDDIDALLVLAHTHPEVESFEPWLRSALDVRSVGGPTVTLTTVHRAKGAEWPHVVVWDASVGLMPHRLADDLEEERRIFHVAMTRCSRSVTIIARARRPSPFLAELLSEEVQLSTA